jgi:Zn-finger nucleic acid-binding protein
MAERECPVCPYTPLVELDAGGGLKVDECPECHGRWYDAGELAPCCSEPDKLEAIIHGEGLDRPRASERACPICVGKLTNGGLVNPLLRVDFCQKCRGFWLDRNEIALLDRLLK